MTTCTRGGVMFDRLLQLEWYTDSTHTVTHTVQCLT